MLRVARGFQTTYTFINMYWTESLSKKKNKYQLRQLILFCDRVVYCTLFTSFGVFTSNIFIMKNNKIEIRNMWTCFIELEFRF